MVRGGGHRTGGDAAAKATAGRHRYVPRGVQYYGCTGSTIYRYCTVLEYSCTAVFIYSLCVYYYTGVPYRYLVGTGSY